jgi:hypothetical protein
VVRRGTGLKITRGCSGSWDEIFHEVAAKSPVISHVSPNFTLEISVPASEEVEVLLKLLGENVAGCKPLREVRDPGCSLKIEMCDK